ncbi:hypothetical protein [Flavobacterium sp.]|uniref:hypothetical protein n=1 Tax=Flavobacterium sp. TaxID=239 RepID=UPI0035AE9676
MKKILIKLLLFASISLMIGCVALPSESMKTFMDSSKKEGMIVGTISIENRKKIAERHSFRFKREGLPNILTSKLVDSLKINNVWENSYNSIVVGNSSGDFKEDEKQVFLFSIVKPAGKYEFYEIEIFLNTGYMQSTWNMPIKMPIEIEEGKVKYLGEINLKVKKGELRLLNNIERDRIKFKEKFPDIKF